MTKFKKEKILFFKKEVKTLCACDRGDDSPWKDERPPSPPPPPEPKPQPKPEPEPKPQPPILPPGQLPLPGFPPVRPFFL